MSGALVAGPALPKAFVVSRQNSNQNSGAVNGTFTILTFGNDVTSVLNGLIDRPTTARFRALVAGYYRISYKGNMTLLTGDTGAEYAVFKNTSTRLPEFNSAGQINASFGTSTIRSSLGASLIVLLAANDFVELAIAPLNASAVQSDADTSFMLELVRAT